VDCGSAFAERNLEEGRVAADDGAAARSQSNGVEVLLLERALGVAGARGRLAFRGRAVTKIVLFIERAASLGWRRAACELSHFLPTAACLRRP
jgi:hypothetical protein